MRLPNSALSVFTGPIIYRLEWVVRSNAYLADLWTAAYYYRCRDQNYKGLESPHLNACEYLERGFLADRKISRLCFQKNYSLYYTCEGKFTHNYICRVKQWDLKYVRKSDIKLKWGDIRQHRDVSVVGPSVFALALRFLPRGFSYTFYCNLNFLKSTVLFNRGWVGSAPQQIPYRWRYINSRICG